MLLECHVIIVESVTDVKRILESAGPNVLVLLKRLSELVTSNMKVSHIWFGFALNRSKVDFVLDLDRTRVRFVSDSSLA